jgi:hypothetical protein
MTNTKQVTITLPIDLLEVLKGLPAKEGRYKGRKVSNLCAVLITERLEVILKEPLGHLLD